MIEDRRGAIIPACQSDGGTVAEMCEGQQTDSAVTETCALPTNLMERICSSVNLNQAYRRVKANKGSPGTDGMNVVELGKHIREHKEQFIKSLLDGSYKPQPVRKVMIPKAGGGERQLGIPSAIDRLVQQAILQVLQPYYDREFSENSFGFRPARSAHDAIKQAQAYVKEGHRWVVDMDLEKFFDRVNHDILMSRLRIRIEDKRLLKIIRGFLTAGIMQDGVVVRRHEGTPQGGPLSPLLSNILLDELDKELERRGHKFCRYADDQNIYVRSQRAGERVYESIKQFLEKKLRLKVNDKKSAVALVGERSFLGYRIQTDGQLEISPVSESRAKDKIRMLAKRNRGKSFELIVAELNRYLQGWFNYYKLAKKKSLWKRMDAWIRRKLRCYRLKQRKEYTSIVKFLVSCGISRQESMCVASSGKGWWRLSRTRTVHRALSNAWFKAQGLYSLSEHWDKLVKA